MLLKIVEAGGQLKSFALASRMLQRLADIRICGRHVGRLTEEIGQELQQARDQHTEDYIHHRRKKPAGSAPAAVAVMIDGGRILTRTPGQGPGVHEQGWKEDKVACLHVLNGPTFASDPHPEVPRCFQDRKQVEELVRDFQAQKGLAPVAEPRGREVPGAAPAAAAPAAAAPAASASPAPASAPSAADTTPVLSGLEVRVFVGTPLRVTMAEQEQLENMPPDVPLAEALAKLRQQASAAAEPSAAAPTVPTSTGPVAAAESLLRTPTVAAAAAAAAAVVVPTAGTKKTARPAWPPQRCDRTCVATMGNSDAFGKHVVAEAHARNFDAAQRRAFLGDGQHYNWTIQEKWFKDYVAITDFIHPLAYLYRAATAVATTEAARWQYFQSWLRMTWQGQVTMVLEELRGWQERLGPIGAEKLPESDPRAVLKCSLTYLQNNAGRMNYPHYRQLGLPVTSAAVESLIKEFNYRVKGTEKFWNQPEGTETILQVRAAVLSDDDRLESHVRNRPGSPYRYQRHRHTTRKKRKAA